MFFDFAPNGAIATIVRTVAEFKKAQNLTDVCADFDSIPSVQQKVALLQTVMNGLTAAGKIPPTTLHFDASLQGAVLEKLTSVAAQLKLEVTETLAQATYIVSGPVSAPNVGSAMVTSNRLGSVTRVHWKGRPASMDQWHGAEDAAAIPVQQQPGGSPPFAVTANWLSDSGRYNELMNVSDYSPSDGTSQSDSEFMAAAEKPADATCAWVGSGGGSVGGGSGGSSSGKRKRETTMEEDLQRLESKTSQQHPLAALHNPAREPKLTKIDNAEPKHVRKGVRTDMTALDGQ